MVKRLSELKKGDVGVVSAIPSKNELGLRLQELGLIPGTSVQLVRAAPFGDPLQIKLRGYNLTVRSKHVEDILVKIK